MAADPTGKGSEAVLQHGVRRDLHALAVWAAAFATTWGVLFAVASAHGEAVSPHAWAARWGRWDFIHFEDIARLGYVPQPGAARTDAPLTAFLPAFPALLAGGQAVGIPPVVAGLVISAVAGAIATVFIARLGEIKRSGAGSAVAAVFAFSPTAIFLFAPYTEALFLAFAIPAWYFATKAKWWLASVLATGASLTRISGIFLIVALLVLWCTRYVAREKRTLRSAAEVLWLSVPTLAILGWMVALYLITGRPMEYIEAQAYWGRSFTDPISAIVSTWTSYSPSPSLWMRSAEIAAFAIGLGTTAVLVVRRSFGDATWVGLNVAALGTSTYLYSVPRSALLWWPLWIAIGTTLASRRWALVVYVILSTGLMVVWDVTYFAGAWAG